MAAETQATDQHTIRSVLATLGEADVCASLIKGGINPDTPRDACDPYRIARVVAPLVVAHARRTLGSLLPSLALVAESSLPMTDLSVRAQNVLVQQDIQTVRDLATFTPERLMRFQNAGRTTVAEFVALAVRVHLQARPLATQVNGTVGLTDSQAVKSEGVIGLARDTKSQQPLIRFFSHLGTSETEALLTRAGIDPTRPIEGCDLHGLARILSPLILQKSNQSLGMLLPGLAFLGNGTLPVAELSVRARNVLAGNAISTCGLFAAHSLDDIRSLGGAGRTTIAEYASLAIRLHLQAAPTLPINEAPTSAPAPPAASPLAGALDRLVEVSTWASTTRQTSTLGDLFTLAIEAEALPPDIAAALSDFRATTLAPCAVSDANVNACLESLWQALDERARDIFVARQLAGAVRPTLEQLGDKHGVGKERVRQIESHACDLLRAELATRSQSPLRWRLHAFACTIRNGVPRESSILTDALAVALRGLTSAKYSQELLLWLAGPYYPRGDWILRQDCEIPSVPISDPRFGGDTVMPQEVATWLREAGFRPDLADVVMRRSDLKQRDGKWLRWGSLLQDKAAVILKVLGRPADTDELAKEIGEGIAERSVRNALQSDLRFMRVSKRAFGLREWGLEEYSGIAEEIAQRIERAGGAVEIEALVEELVQTFGVAASSVRMYAEAPRFVVSNGTVRFRTSDDVLHTDARVHATCGLFPDPARRRVHLVIPVDADVERGSGVGIRAAVATALGVKPGERLHFDDGAGGRILISWPDSAAAGPSLGSTRQLARTVGAVCGDSLLISFHLDTHSVRGSLIRPTTTDLAALTGLDIEKGRELEALAASIGCSPAEVRTVLARRGDQQLLDAIPIPRADSHLEAAMSSLSEILRES